MCLCRGRCPASGRVARKQVCRASNGIGRIFCRRRTFRCRVFRHDTRRYFPAIAFIATTSIWRYNSGQSRKHERANLQSVILICSMLQDPSVRIRQGCMEAAAFMSHGWNVRGVQKGVRVRGDWFGRSYRPARVVGCRRMIAQCPLWGCSSVLQGRHAQAQGLHDAALRFGEDVGAVPVFRFFMGVLFPSAPNASETLKEFRISLVPSRRDVEDQPKQCDEGAHIVIA